MRSEVWENFNLFTDANGNVRAECKRCHRVLGADTRNGTSTLWNHVRICRNRVPHQAIQLEELMAQLPQQQPPLLPPAPALAGDPSSPPPPHGVQGVAGPSQQPMYPRPTISLSEPGSSMHDLDEELLQMWEFDFQQLLMPDNVGAPPVSSVQEAAAMSVGAAPLPQQQQPPPPPSPYALSRSGPAGGGSSDSDHDPTGLEEASEHLAPRLYALSVLEEQDLEVEGEEQVHHEPAGLEEDEGSTDQARMEPGHEVEVEDQALHGPVLEGDEGSTDRARMEVEVEGQALHGPVMEEDEASRDLARMIALHGYDPSIVEDNHFGSFVKRLNPEFQVPSRVTIDNMCDAIFDEARRDLLVRAQSTHGRVSVAVGRAKTMEEQVLYVACHFIDDGWNLHKVLLHAIVTTDHHDDNDGPILGLDISAPCVFDFQVCSVIDSPDYGIHSRLFMVAYENTDKDIHPGLKQEFCFFEPGLLCSNPDRKEILFTTYVDNVLHSIAQCLLRGQDYTTVVLCDMQDLPSLRMTRQGRLEILAELDLHHGWACEQHWYACYCSLKVLCKKGFPDECTPADKFITELLCKLWEKIYHAIQKISSSTRPTANLCLAELFKLREILQDELKQFSSADHGDDYDVIDDDKDVMFVLREARCIIDKAIQDSYLAWSLPLVLDPRYKLEFISFSFKRVYRSKSAKEYISKVRRMITELYADYAKEYGTTHGADHSDGASSAMDITTSADNPLGQAWNEHCRSQAETELDRYLNDRIHDPQEKDFDILSWWKAHSSKYPMVSRMARDALAMPTCSKLSSDQMAQLRSILRGYSEKPYKC